MTDPGTRHATTTDEDRYQLALAGYQQARERVRRIAKFVYGEYENPDMLADADRAERDEAHARQELLALAPDQPTTWWPGGWTARSGTRPFGYGGLPGQATGTNVWRSAAEARACQTAFFPDTEPWTVSWTPATHRHGQDTPIDAAFWATTTVNPPWDSSAT